MNNPRDILLAKVRQQREDFYRYEGRIQISKTQLKKFKITQENCDLYDYLARANGNWMLCLDIEPYIAELTNQGLIFKAQRHRR